MKIAILGPGALGCLLAAKFTLGRENVCLVDYRPERVARLRHRGLKLRTPEGREDHIQAPVGLATETGPSDLVILTVKAYQTAAAAQALPQLLGPTGVALTLQNGLGNLEEMARVVGSQRLLGGATILGATKLGEGEVLLAGVGPTYIGAPAGSQVPPARLEAVAALFRRAGLPCEVRKDIATVLWEKLLVNVGINPLTALLRIKNGVLPHLAPAWGLAVAAATETQAVARAEGVPLAVPPEARLREVCAATAANRSSMLQDVLAGRRTEIDALNAQVVLRGAAAGLPTPVNQVLTELIRALEGIRLGNQAGEYGPEFGSPISP
ncbi:MAG: ketopantoate reductase family protein [Desulfobaccales bacterium]